MSIRAVSNMQSWIQMSMRARIRPPAADEYNAELLDADRKYKSRRLSLTGPAGRVIASRIV
jgi:hypothetical protein